MELLFELGFVLSVLPVNVLLIEWIAGYGVVVAVVLWEEFIIVCDVAKIIPIRQRHCFVVSAGSRVLVFGSHALLVDVVEIHDLTVERISIGILRIGLLRVLLLSPSPLTWL